MTWPLVAAELVDAVCCWLLTTGASCNGSDLTLANMVVSTALLRPIGVPERDAARMIANMLERLKCWMLNKNVAGWILTDHLRVRWRTMWCDSCRIYLIGYIKTVHDRISRKYVEFCGMFRERNHMELIRLSFVVNLFVVRCILGICNIFAE